MALSFVAGAASIGAPLAKLLMKSFFGEKVGSVAGGLIDLAAKKIGDEAQQRIAARAFEDFSDKIVEKLLPLFSELDASQAEAIAFELGKTIEIQESAEALLVSDLNPSKIVALLLRTRPLPNGQFSKDEIALYHRALDETIRYLIAVAGNLPRFQVEAHKASLTRLTQIGKDLDDSLDRLQRIEQALDRQKSRGDEEASQLRYEADYRQALVGRLDYLELFGADINPEAQRHSLTVGYVSLSVSGSADNSETNPIGADRIFELLKLNKGRLLVRGDAGSGKSTLLRWVAIRSALGDSEGDWSTLRALVSQHFLPGSMHSGARRELAKLGYAQTNLSRTWLAAFQAGEAVFNPGLATSAPGVVALQSIERLYSTLDVPHGRPRKSYVPFLVRLREFQDGRLPSPETLPELVAPELGPPPDPKWVRGILAEGRAVVLIDGLDEISKQRRAAVRRELDGWIKQYPKSQFLVSSRPAAIPRGWLASLDFTEAHINPLTDLDRTTLIRRWHAAVESELARQGRPADLSALANELIAKLVEVPSIARLTTNPLLCAAICALHKDRHKKLPESQAELCEALCHLLLHRRELEAGLDIQAIDHDYFVLSYEQKRAIVQQIAHHMVRNEESIVSEADAIAEIEAILSTFPGGRAGSAKEVLSLMIERCGVLREQRPGYIDFVHNTIKEFLAAELFVQRKDINMLAKRAADDPWRQIVLFTSATRDREFATRLIQRILANADETADSDAKRRLLLAALNCRYAALHLDPSLVSEIAARERSLVPPKSFSDAELLSASGDNVVPLLKARTMQARSAAACVRTLRLIGTEAAHQILRGYFNDERKEVIAELAQATNPLNLDAVIKTVQRGGWLPPSIARNISDLSPLVTLPPLETLRMHSTQLSDIAPISTMQSLKEVDLRACPVTSIEALAELPFLETLVLNNTKVASIDALSHLSKLRHVAISDTPVEDLSPLSQIDSLRFLDVGHTKVRSIAPVSKSGNLEYLDLSGTEVSDVAELKGAPSLRILSLSGARNGEARSVDWGVIGLLTQLTDLRAMYTNLRQLDELGDLLPQLSTLILHKSALASLKQGRVLRKLTTLDVSHTSITELSGIESMPALDSIDLSLCPISDLSPLASLKCLLDLDVSDSLVTDISTLPSLETLESLTLANCNITNPQVLSELRGLKSLSIAGSDISHLNWIEPLAELENLEIDGCPIVNIEAILHLERITTLAVPALPAKELARLRKLPSLEHLYVAPPE